MKKLFLILAGLLAVFAGIVGYNTLQYTSGPPPEGGADLIAVDREAAIDRLSSAIQLQTISFQDRSKMDPVPFLALHDLVDRQFPGVARTLEKTVINQYALLYKWEGKNPDLLPGALLAHMDVVPVAPETRNDWARPPFSGDVAEGFVWGRGTLDMKGTLMAVLEAVESLVASGFVPERTLYLAFGHDEEVGGEEGAAMIARHLKDQGVSLAFTLDEGMVVLDPGLSPSKKDLAVIGVAEKGYVTLEIKTKGTGGHSSMPGLTTPIGSLARAAHRLETRQMPAALSGAAGLLFDAIGPDLPLVQKMLFANQWAFSPLILKVLEGSKTTNAMVRTTTALTMIAGGVKENVLPDSARLLVNFRLLPGDTVDSVMAHAKKVIDDDSVAISVHGRQGTAPSPVASVTASAYRAVEQAVGDVFPGIKTAPGLVMAGTDTKHYIDISENSYRFAPFVFGPDDPARIHGVNERVPVDGYINAIQYYGGFIKHAFSR